MYLLIKLVHFRIQFGIIENRVILVVRESIFRQRVAESKTDRLIDDERSILHSF